MNKLIIATFLLITFNLSSQKLEKLWETDTIFSSPESVLYHKSANCLYVANIGGKAPWAKDGYGAISKLGLDGKVINIDWVTGLNAPKGMAVDDKNLYVADVDQLVTINLASGQIVNRLNVNGSMTLNDVTLLGKGKVLVSDSRGRAAYVIENNTFKIVLDSSKLGGPNGVLNGNGKYFILDRNAVNEVSKDFGKLTKLVGDMPGGIDGIEPISKNEYIVSCWSGTVYFVDTKSKTKKLLLDTTADKINAADIGYYPKDKIVYVPTFFKNSVVAYKVVK
jgi:hypothetical protein